MAVTIKDVAAFAGVSPSTVSRTCNNNPSISKETREKVLNAMQKLGYEPSSSASSAQSIKILGIILPPSARETFENSFFLEVIRGISSICNSRQYISTIITGENYDEIISAVKTMTDNDIISGFIVAYSITDDPVVEYLHKEGLKYVLIGKASKYTDQTVYVDNDNILAGKEATEYLIGLGHKNIAYIGNKNSLIFSAERKQGYMLSLISHGLKFTSDSCIEADTIEDVTVSVKKMLEGENVPTAMVVSDDIFAVAVEKVCGEMNIAVPEDLSIISFNNSILARLTAYQLTSIEINSFRLGTESAAQMIKLIEDPDSEAKKIIIPHKLTIRDSCSKRI